MSHNILGRAAVVTHTISWVVTPNLLGVRWLASRAHIQYGSHCLLQVLFPLLAPTPIVSPSLIN